MLQLRKNSVILETGILGYLYDLKIGSNTHKIWKESKISISLQNQFFQNQKVKLPFTINFYFAIFQIAPSTIIAYYFCLNIYKKLIGNLNDFLPFCGLNFNFMDLDYKFRNVNTD